MSTNNKSRIFTRFVAGPIAAAGILGGVALGVAAGANADPGPSDHPSGGYSADFRHGDDSHRDFREFRPDFWDFWFWHHHRDHSFGWHRDS
jgi:hypothetical protein